MKDTLNYVLTAVSAEQLAARARELEGLEPWSRREVLDQREKTAQAVAAVELERARAEHARAEAERLDAEARVVEARARAEIDANVRKLQAEGDAEARRRQFAVEEAEQAERARAAAAEQALVVLGAEQGAAERKLALHHRTARYAIAAWCITIIVGVLLMRCV